MGYWYHCVSFDLETVSYIDLIVPCRYTLAVGKAPFHAAKREEIYKKLQNREYEWPDLSKHQNDISNDLRDLVGSLLVDEDDRPNPDQIVSHSFFKTSFIPDHLDSSCKAIKPSWPHTRPPSAETIRRGYSESWFKLCKESGVGEYAPGRMFPVVGLVNCSLVKDVEREIKAGKAPSVPIAQGTVYLPFISERKDKNKAGTNLSEIVEESSAGSSGAGSHLMEISANDRVARPLRTIKAVPSKRFKENMNPIASDNERPETAVRVQRPDTALRRARSNRGRTENTKKIDPVLQHSTRTYKPSSAMGGQALLTPPNEAEPEIRREPLQSVADEARALFARLDAERAAEKAVENSSKAANTLPDPPRPTNTRSRTASQQETRESETRKPPVRPRPRGRVASNENQHIEAILPPTIANTHTERPIRPNAIPVPVESKTLTIAPQRRGDRKAQVAETVRTMRRPAERPMSPQEPKSASPEDIADASVRNTDPTTVLAMATNLRNNLLETLSGKVPTTKGKEKPQALPFVTKWVDYAKKHGIGYVLSDGTVGCVFIATDDLPARHVIVRNGPSHLSAISADSLSKISMASLPLEFYSIGSTDSIKPMQFEGEQKKANGLLWAKFARYMCSSLSGTSERSATPDEGGATDNIMVRYYQRLGNVGVWGFSNGCYQVNFPDHTKLVISADGKQCSFTCLPLEGISHLQSTGDLPLKYVRQRAVLNGSAYALIYDHVDQSLAVANMLHLKLQYILDLVSLWVEGGGLGCRPRNKQWPKWTGAQLEESTGRKVDWITVGRFGREAVVVERAPKD